MSIELEKWQYPIGRYQAKEVFLAEEITASIAVLKAFPKDLKEVLAQCSKEDIEQPYRPGGWTIKQLVHHIADSHMHSYMRCKYAFLEKSPTIKGYQENEWAEKCPDANVLGIASSIKILEGIHERWTYFFEHLSMEDFEREYDHPERDKNFPLKEVVYFYAWHAQHHLSHIKQYLKFKA